MLGLVPVTKWTRTEAGDTWATTGAERLRRLESLPLELETDPQSAARVAAMAGALMVTGPGDGLCGAYAPPPKDPRR